MKRCITLLVLITVLTTTSCDPLFFTKNYIKKDRIPQHELNDVYIYSTFDNSKIDSFTVTFVNDEYNYMEDVNSQEIQVSMNYPRYSETYLSISVWSDCGDIHYKYGRFTYDTDGETSDFIINGIKYKDVYVLKEDTGGDSDSVIDRILYHGITGAISYRYENGDEYLLDTIIKVE